MATKVHLVLVYAKGDACFVVSLLPVPAKKGNLATTLSCRGLFDHAITGGRHKAPTARYPPAIVGEDGRGNAIGGM